MSDEEKTVVSYYDKLKSEDLIEWARPLIERAGYRVRFGDGKLEPTTSMHHDSPWHHTCQSDELDCSMRMSIMWKVVFNGLDADWVPSECQECWKIVCRPPTLLGLFALEALQLRLGYSAKCGIEVRPWVCGNYGGYWYCKSKEEGRERYNELRKEIDEDPALGPDVPLLLKRGCTEYELKHGPSDKWEVKPAQLHVEEIVKRLIHSGTNFSPQAKHLVTRVHRRWIEHAYSVGDETYKYFTNGEPISPAYVTYHDEPSREDKGAAGAKAGKKSAPLKKKRSKK